MNFADFTPVNTRVQCQLNEPKEDPRRCRPFFNAPSALCHSQLLSRPISFYSTSFFLVLSLCLLVALASYWSPFLLFFSLSLLSLSCSAKLIFLSPQELLTLRGKMNVHSRPGHNYSSRFGTLPTNFTLQPILCTFIFHYVFGNLYVMSFLYRRIYSRQSI